MVVVDEGEAAAATESEAGGLALWPAAKPIEDDEREECSGPHAP